MKNRKIFPVFNLSLTVKDLLQISENSGSNDDGKSTLDGLSALKDSLKFYALE